VLFVIAHAIEMAEGFNAGRIVAVSGILAQVMDHRASSAEGLRMSLQAEAG